MLRDDPVRLNVVTNPQSSKYPDPVPESKMIQNVSLVFKNTLPTITKNS